MQPLCNQNFNALPCRSTPFTTVNYGESYGSGVRRLARPVTTSAFVGTNPKDEPITSGLAVNRELMPIPSVERRIKSHGTGAVLLFGTVERTGRRSS